MYMKVITKTCAKCGKNKILDEYWNHPNGKYGKRPRCKECVREQNSQYYHKPLEGRYSTHGEKIKESVRRWNKTNDNKRRRNLRERYGITIEEYESLLELQDHKCAICGKSMDEGRRLAVDHDHKTKKIRGIIHLRCNTAIALFGESPEICRKAAEYLEKHGKI
jgi:predicted  nucleic acid-binding Zn-ribbon protein